MTLGSRLRGGTVAAAVILLAAACTTGTADAPAPSAVTSPTASPSVIDPSTFLSGSSAPPASPTPSATQSVPPSLDPAAQEAADRAAIEVQWQQFWLVVLGAVRLPDDQREAALANVAVDPLKSQILTEVRDSEAHGLDRYGSVTQHPYWEQRIEGADTAVMGDCQDASQSGTVNISTGKHETVGVKDNNTRVAFERGSDGIWRVKDIYYLVDVPC